MNQKGEDRGTFTLLRPLGLEQSLLFFGLPAIALILLFHTPTSDRP